VRCQGNTLSVITIHPRWNLYSFNHSVSGKLIAQCGAQLQLTSLLSWCLTLSLVFTQINCFKFFLINREVLDIQGLNYVILTDANGYISSPNYPLEYDDYVDCRWLIQAPEFNYRIIVYFMGNFTTKTGFDRLTVSLIYKDLNSFHVPWYVGKPIKFYDGATTSSPVMLDWSGHEYFYPWITSKTDKMLIQFTSLRGQSEKGFKLRYYTVVKFNLSK
jgi:hypothetical protein